jgi:hypothetical protein
MLKTKSLENKFDNMTLKNEYSRRLSEKLNAINCNLKIMDPDSLPYNDGFEDKPISLYRQTPSSKHRNKKITIVENQLDEHENEEDEEDEENEHNEDDDDDGDGDNNLKNYNVRSNNHRNHDDFDDIVNKNDYMQMAFHYKNLCKVGFILYFVQNDIISTNVFVIDLQEAINRFA